MHHWGMQSRAVARSRQPEDLEDDMEIRNVREGEGAELRALRLKALADAPSAFSTSLADAEKVPMEGWEERARRYATGERDEMFVAVEGQRWYGLAGGYFPHDQASVAQLFSMWVDPEKRRMGLGLSLVEAVVQWAREHGAGQVELCVKRDNSSARALYERAGFLDAGDVEAPSSSEAPDEIVMRLELR